jgi:hypothetical protein
MLAELMIADTQQILERIRRVMTEAKVGAGPAE